MRRFSSLPVSLRQRDNFHQSPPRARRVDRDAFAEPEPIGANVACRYSSCRQMHRSQLLTLLPVDLLVFAPHPDDEVICAGGLIQQAVAAKKSVRIVFVTSGDAYPQAASALLGKSIQDLRAP